MKSIPCLRLLLLVLSLIACGTPRAQDSGPRAASQIQLPATDDGLPGQGPIRRYDWFRNLWNQRRATWAGRVERDRHAVVMLGDSITQGWGDDFSGWFPGMKVVNRGISGDTSRGVLIRLQGDVLALAQSGGPAHRHQRP